MEQDHADSIIEEEESDEISEDMDLMGGASNSNEDDASWKRIRKTDEGDDLMETVRNTIQREKAKDKAEKTDKFVFSQIKEVEKIKEHMQKSPYPLIVCGDFNDTPLSYAYHSIKQNLVDAFNESGKGFGNSFVRIPVLRIDYILHDPQFKSTNYKTYPNILSDHYAVSCEITIP